MEKAKKDVGQKFRRIKHNLVNSSKIENHEDWRHVGDLETRNSKVVQSISTFKKNVGNTIRTGLKEENVDKRRKKVEEFGISADLKEGALDLQKSSSTCLFKVMNKIAQTLSTVAEEKVKYEMMIEKRVLEDLNQYIEMDKQISRNREKLTNALTDLDIARKANERTETAHQENVDNANQRLENQMDSTVTEIYNFASKEQEIAKVFTSFLEELLEYHRTALRTIEMALPELRRDIDNARPRPIFGLDLSEHLRHHSNDRIAIPIRECCNLLRRIGFTEKGVFRVSGNSLKMKRMRGSFDSGQIEHDIQNYEHDPHSVCGVLKWYLRELPDPLLTNRLHSEWLHAVSLDNENRMVAFEQCLGQLPQAHLDNLTYLVKFLVDLLAYQEKTSMNVTNLAIVFGPNLLGGDIEESNAAGNKIVETFLNNSERLFGITPSEMQTSYHIRHVPEGRALSLIIESSEPSKHEFSLSQQLSFRQSPKTRPKERAPPPPQVSRQFADEWSSDSNSEPNSADARNSHERWYPRSSIGSFTESSQVVEPESMTSSLISLTSKAPHRPPPPTTRSSTGSDHDNILVNVGDVSRSLSTVYLDASNRTLVSVPVTPTPSVRIKPPLPVKPKTDDHHTFTTPL